MKFDSIPNSIHGYARVRDFRESSRTKIVTSARIDFQVLNVGSLMP